jgi:hypothetical protein
VKEAVDQRAAEIGTEIGTTEDLLSPTAVSPDSIE